MKDNKLEQQIRDLIKEELPKTSLLSHGFFTRAFAVLGHYIAAWLFVCLVIFGVVFAFSMLGALMSIF